MFAEPILRHPGRDPSTWRVRDDGGRVLAVKQVADRRAVTIGGKDALATEWRTLSLLFETGAAVPKPVAYDPDSGLLVTEWASGPTVDDLCQDDAETARSALPIALARLGFIEQVMAARVAELEPYVCALNYDGYLTDDFQQFAELAWSGFTQLARLGDARDRACEAAWLGALDVIVASEPTLGSLDYNARNVVIGTDDARFLDFSTIGWDWPERRVVQYFTGLGAYRSDGTFVSALTADALERSRDVLFFNPQAVEAHLVVFLCVAAERLLRGGVGDDEDMAPSSADSGWVGRRRRFEALVGLLAGNGLADFGATRELRQRVRSARAV